MSEKTTGSSTARCMYCTAWERDQLPDEHSHVIKFDYDNTCDTVTLCLDGKVMFNIDLKDWEPFVTKMKEWI
jgi:hypothetical protein